MATERDFADMRNEYLGKGSSHMPFKSKAQRSFLYAKKPAVAKEFAAKTSDEKDLPQHAKSKKGKSPWMSMKKSEGY